MLKKNTEGISNLMQELGAILVIKCPFRLTDKIQNSKTIHFLITLGRQKLAICKQDILDDTLINKTATEYFSVIN